MKQIVTNASGGLPTVMNWVLFTLATLLLAKWFEQSRLFLNETNPFQNLLPFLGITALLLVVLTLMIFDMYLKEKVKGRLARKIALFDFLEQQFFSAASKGDPPV
jgi:DMSO/TMAO reductase YedYZ heme-binding membrane subunit